jgi:hypothetical protein
VVKQTLDIKYEYDFILIGISCHEKEYRLSWALNNSLQLELARISDMQIELKKQTEPLSYPIFEYDDTEHYRKYYLISNKTSKGMLVPEQKQADFLLMIKGSLQDPEKLALLKAIKNTQLVLMAFEINPESLKSRDNLLF